MVQGSLTISGSMGGRETLQELRKIDPDVKAVAAIGYSDDPVIAGPIHFGFKAALLNPFSIKQLEEVLQKLI